MESATQDRVLTLHQEHRAATPTLHERTFGRDEIIVSKTDLLGKITYANEVFCRVALYSNAELLGQPHSIVRHPDMPRCVFKFLWDTISDGREIFAYVKNMARNGDFYWVLAHVTPTFDSKGQICGYHSNRRCPEKKAYQVFEPVYQLLLDIEKSTPDRRAGLERSTQALLDFLKKNQVTYDELIFSVTNS